ncbi:MAG: Mfa1 family fimbria major subunit [Alistipes sp.]|nr:Mfa1 family fimbria major subunit [Alistipes sp.]
MKKYLFLAVALLGMASCAKDDIANGNNPIHSGEIEESYIAINLSASDITRAQTGFEDGTAEERAVHHADFFFFDEAGNPFNVTGNPATTSGGATNHLHAADITFATDEDGGDDISDSSAAVLLLQTYKGEYPSQIVAVLNWSPDTKPYTLDELHAAVNLTGKWDTEDYFVMSNAVYAQNGKAVYATPLSYDNIKSSEKDAENNPVSIYVERVAAKVKLETSAKYDLQEEVMYHPLGGTTTIEGGVFAKIISWDLYRDNTQSQLLKVIDETWTDDSLGFPWNNAPWYRSYWAESLSAPTDDQIFGNSPFTPGTHTYIGENTTGKESCTKVVIKAQLVTTVGEEDKPLELAIWNNVEYVDEVADEESKGGESLRIAVANTLKNTYFANTKDGYVGLMPEDLKCVAGGGEGAPEGVKANEVYFQLSETGEAKDWYKLVNGEYKPVADDITKDANSKAATNNALKSVPAAVLYKSGETFYYVDIKHLGAAGKPAEYGIVRNHVYNVKINTIKGYGSPVYTGVSYLEYPQITEQSTFVSAQINILSWRLVNQEVDIETNPSN